MESSKLLMIVTADLNKISLVPVALFNLEETTRHYELLNKDFL